ncbi:hypothetical protein GGH99_007687, partial [Coemansia sp. RSA 1285]
MIDSVRRSGSGGVAGEAPVSKPSPSSAAASVMGRTGSAVRSVHSNRSGSIQNSSDADRSSRRYSVTALYSIVAERDEEVSDELSE